MTLTIDFPAAILEKVRQQAKLSGTDVNAFVLEAVSAKVQGSSRTLREILDPVHNEVEASGISDAELEKMFDRELVAVRAERKI
jgi:hypothetical protein